MKLGVEEILLIILVLIILYNFGCKIEGWGEPGSCREYTKSCLHLSEAECNKKYTDFNGPKKCSYSIVPFVGCTPDTSSCYKDCQCENKDFCNLYKHCLDISELKLGSADAPPQGLQYYRERNSGGSWWHWARNDKKTVTQDQKNILDEMYDKFNLIEIRVEKLEGTFNGHFYKYKIYVRTDKPYPQIKHPTLRFYDETMDYYDNETMHYGAHDTFAFIVYYNSSKPTLTYIVSNEGPEKYWGE